MELKSSKLFVPYWPVFLALIAKGLSVSHPEFDRLVFPLLLFAILFFHQNEGNHERRLKNPVLAPVARFYESAWMKAPLAIVIFCWLLIAVRGVIEKF